MTDIYLEWTDDWQVDATGDLMTVDGDTETRQRLERRLFTAVKSYIWHPEFGAGLPQRIGDPYSEYQIRSIVASQLALEADVAPNPPAQLTVSQQPGGYMIIGIKYWNAKSGISVSFEITS